MATPASNEFEPSRMTGQSEFSLPAIEDIAAQMPQLEVLEYLGHGGMGAVYRGRQRLLDRPVAIKILRPDLCRDHDLRERFLQEARTLARLRHPYVVTIHDIGVTDEFIFLVMEYVAGVNLRQRIADQSLSERDALNIIPQVSEALGHAHSTKIVHRDIKPENILIDETGRVRLVDFGLATWLSAHGVEEQRIVGTLGYIAPEQIFAPASVDHRADIYSLGVVFHEVLTGKRPLPNSAAPSTIAGTDRRLDPIVKRATESDRELRYQQAQHLTADVVKIARTPQSTVIVEKRIPAPRESVFAAWTEPTMMMQWLAPNDEYSTPLAEVDLQPGGNYRIGMRPPDKDEVRVMSGQICKVDAPNSLSFTWMWLPPHGDQRESQVTLEFEPVEGGTNVRLTHERFQSENIRNDHERGWTGCLNRLEQKALQLRW